MEWNRLAQVCTTHKQIKYIHTHTQTFDWRCFFCFIYSVVHVKVSMFVVREKKVFIAIVICYACSSEQKQTKPEWQ